MKKWVKILVHVFDTGCYAMHLWTVWIAYFRKGEGAAFLTFLTPVLSWIYWFFVMWKNVGFWHWYNITLIVLLVAGGIIGWKYDDQAESSQSPQSQEEESHGNL